MEIQFEVVAHCLDGVGGRVSHVLIHQRSWKVISLVVREPRAGGEDWIVPLERLESAGEGEVRLSCTLAELRQHESLSVFVELAEPLYKQTGRAVGPGVYAMLEAAARQALLIRLPAGCQALSPALPVGAEDGQVGRMTGVRYEPKYRLLSALVVRRGVLWFKKQFSIPARAIASIEDDCVQLKLDRCQVQDLLVVQQHR